MRLGAALWIIVLGILGAANLIIARKPQARELISKLAPYQGWIGAVSAFWGAWVVIHAVLNISWLKVIPIFWVTYLSMGALLTALGLLLGVGVLKSFIKAPAAQEKMDAAITRLAPMQGTLGLVAIGLGGWGLVAGLLW